MLSNWCRAASLSAALLFTGLAPRCITAAEVQVPETVAKHAAVSKTPPPISLMARQMKISGHVEVALEIDEAGNVTAVRATQGPPVLSSGVVEAVKKWKFTPFTDSAGAAAKATTTLSFDFKL